MALIVYLPGLRSAPHTALVHGTITIPSARHKADDPAPYHTHNFPSCHRLRDFDPKTIDRSLCMLTQSGHLGSQVSR